VRPGSLALLGLAAYSAFLVAGMPARWVAERVLPPGPRSYALQEIDGTIWRGSARAAFGTHAGTLAIDQVQWRFLPVRLLQGRAAYEVHVDDPAMKASGELGRTLGGWNIRGNAGIDAALLTRALPWTAPWRPEGRVSLDVPGMQLAGQEARGKAELEWRDASTALSEVKPLGSYRAQIEAAGPSADVRVSTVQGALRVAGQGRLEFPSRFTFSGEARGEGPQAAALQPLLDLMGPRKPDGTHAIAWRAR
jgi:general secretion pathway protein N